MAAHTPEYFPCRTPRAATSGDTGCVARPLHLCHPCPDEPAVTPKAAEEAALSVSKFGQGGAVPAHRHPEIPGNFLLPGSARLLAGMDLLGRPTVLCRMVDAPPPTPPVVKTGERYETPAWTGVVFDDLGRAADECTDAIIKGGWLRGLRKGLRGLATDEREALLDIVVEKALDEGVSLDLLGDIIHSVCKKIASKRAGRKPRFEAVCRKFLVAVEKAARRCGIWAHSDPIVLPEAQFADIMSTLSGARAAPGELVRKVKSKVESSLKSKGRHSPHDCADAFQMGIEDCLSADDPERFAEEDEVLKVFRNAADRFARFATRGVAEDRERRLEVEDRERRLEAAGPKIEALRYLPERDRSVFTAYLLALGDKAVAAESLGVSRGHYGRVFRQSLLRYGCEDSR